MPKLNQVNAIVTGRKGETEKFVGDLYKLLQVKDKFVGFDKEYRPIKEDEDKLPPEKQKVEFRCWDLVQQAAEQWSELWDLILTQDVGNQIALAELKVDDKFSFPKVPVTFLLFLQKQINDVTTMVKALPTPDTAKTWEVDKQIGLLRSAPEETMRTKKIPKAIVKYDATEHHPAQTEVFNDDKVVGHYLKTHYSGAISVEKKGNMLQKLRVLADAIKVAREQANMASVENQRIGKALFEYVMND